MGYYLEYMCTYYKSFLIFSSLQHSINFSTWIYWKLMVLLSPKNIKIVLKNEYEYYSSINEQSFQKT